MAALGGQPFGEESPGSTETRCRITSGGGDPRESATENKPPARFAGPARVKRWGKSPPRDRQRKRHGKPHREQDQIGAARRATGSGVSASPPGSVARGARQRASQRNGHPSPQGEDRTRLTGRLTCLHRSRRCNDSTACIPQVMVPALRRALFLAPPGAPKVAIAQCDHINLSYFFLKCALTSVIMAGVCGHGLLGSADPRTRSGCPSNIWR